MRRWGSNWGIGASLSILFRAILILLLSLTLYSLWFHRANWYYCHGIADGQVLECLPHAGQLQLERVQPKETL